MANSYGTIQQWRQKLRRGREGARGARAKTSLTVTPFIEELFLLKAAKASKSHINNVSYVQGRIQNWNLGEGA